MIAAYVVKLHSCMDVCVCAHVGMYARVYVCVCVCAYAIMHIISLHSRSRRTSHSTRSIRNRAVDRIRGRDIGWCGIICSKPTRYTRSVGVGINNNTIIIRDGLRVVLVAASLLAPLSYSATTNRNGRYANSHHIGWWRCSSSCWWCTNKIGVIVSVSVFAVSAAVVAVVVVLVVCVNVV